MNGTMLALQMTAPGRLKINRLPVPSPRPGHVLIRTQIATICTSDLHDLDHNPFQIPLPRVLGHEGAGVVALCGEGVTTLLPGDPVAVHPVASCGTCAECERGYGHHCTDMVHLGLHVDGAFAEYFEQRADRVRKVPETVPARVRALLEPVCVCLQGLARAGDMTGKVLVIIGDGPFGIIMARMALRDGAGKVILVGHRSFRLAKADGAVQILSNAAEETVKEILSNTPNGGGADAVILAVASATALDLGVAALRPQGRLVLFSPPPVGSAPDLFKVHVRELEIVGACNDEDRIGEASAMLTDPSLRLEEIVTHILPVALWSEAFILARNGHDHALKVALAFSETL
jgi:threonine dehydrogenase-like Zn-dependent dehydrogenase